MVARPRGFSLIELLVATAIMTMVLMISSMGYSFFMDRWTHQRENFEVVAKEAKRLILTREALLGLYPYVVRDKDNNPVIFFEGNSDSFVGVTSQSIFVESQMAVVRMRVQQEDDFSYSLLYEEYPLKSMPLTTLQQEFEFEYSTTLLTGMNDMSIEYFGDRNRESYSGNPSPRWWNSFNALSRQIMPEIIRISYQTDDQRHQLHFSASQVDTRALMLFEDGVW